MAAVSVPDQYHGSSSYTRQVHGSSFGLRQSGRDNNFSRDGGGVEDMGTQLADLERCEMDMVDGRVVNR